MKRDVRLQALSSDHHHALALARRLLDLLAAGQAEASLAREVEACFAADLEPHFRIEEEVLLPGLRAAGAPALVQRTEADHEALRRAAAAISAGDLDQIAAFADRLLAHVRFEERELFPCCEACLDGEALEEASRRASKKSR